MFFGLCEIPILIARDATNTTANAEWQAFANTTLRQLAEKNEYSQYAPDEGMRNATTASSDMKITDLQVDEPDAGATKKPTTTAVSAVVAPTAVPQVGLASGFEPSLRA